MIEIKARPVLAALAAATLWAIPMGAAQAGCEGCEFKDRGNRSEGVHSFKIPVSGETFRLMSVQYRGDAAGDAGAQVHLYFWMPAAASLSELKVWRPMDAKREREKVEYRMEPKQKHYDAGLQRFEWPGGDVVARLDGVKVDSLYALIKSGEAYVPGLVTTGASPATSGAYEFWFESSGEIVADCHIERVAADGTRTGVGFFDCSDDASRFSVEWDGRDDDGNAAPDGLYVLRFDGEMALASSNSNVAREIRFWHRGDLK